MIIMLLKCPVTTNDFKDKVVSRGGVGGGGGGGGGGGYIV